MSKQELLDQLIDLLETEYNLHEEVLKISQKKTDIIIGGKVSELEGVVKLEQSFVAQESKINIKKEELVSQLSNETSLKEETWNVSELIKLSSPQQREKLKAYQVRMTNLIDQLNQSNQLNAKLIGNSLEFIEFSLNLVSSADVAGNNYGNKGDTLDKEKKNLFDMKL